MAFFKTVASFAGNVEASTDVESIIKEASESGVSRNDIIVHHNLTEGNVFTGENLVKIAEDEEPSILLVAVEAYEKLASGEIDDEVAMGMITEVGLVPEDFNDIADLIDKQASEAGVVASEAVWEKIAEAHDYLVAADLDPVTALEFASEYSAADSEEAQDKVASEFEGLDDESLDKIAEVVEFLSDIEGISTSDLMVEYSKEASMKGMADTAAKLGKKLSDNVSEKASKVSELGKKLSDNVSGKSLKAAKEEAKPKSFRLHNKKKADANVEAAKSDTMKARLAVGAGVGALAGGVALNKQASEIEADDAVWDKVAEAHEFLLEAGLDPVTSMEFAETFSAADSEEAQDKVASEFEGLDENVIDKIAEAFEYLGDIEGVDVSVLMSEVDKEAGAKKMSDTALKAVKAFGKDVSGKGVAEAKAGTKAKSFRLHDKKKSEATLKGATRRRNIARGVVAGGTAATAVGASTLFKGRG